MKQILHGLCLWFCVLCSFSIYALIPFTDNGSLLGGGKSALSVHSYLSHQRAIRKKQPFSWDLVGNWDHGVHFHRSVNMRYFLGMGLRGVQAGSFLKWVPFPDYKTQPAVGISVGLGYSLSDFLSAKSFGLATHFFELYFRPLVSKEFNTHIGKLTPHLAVPIVIQTNINNSRANIPVQVVLGLRGEISFIHSSEWDYHIEGGIGVNSSSFHYISIGIVARLP